MTITVKAFIPCPKCKYNVKGTANIPYMERGVQGDTLTCPDHGPYYVNQIRAGKATRRVFKFIREKAKL